MACLTALVERCSSVDWTVSFSVMWRDSFTICGNSVVYQSAPVVDLCRRLFPVIMQFAPRRRSVRRTPAGFFLNPVSDESLDPDDHPARICFPQLFSMSSLKTNWRLSDFFTQLIQIQLKLLCNHQRTIRLTGVWVTFLLNYTYTQLYFLLKPHWLTRRDVTPTRTLIGLHRCHWNNY